MRVLVVFLISSISMSAQLIGGSFFFKTQYRCGAYIAPEVLKEFMCYNLGANTSANPHEPIEEINGDYYQWGVKDPVATATALIGVWNPNVPVSNLQDPCPAGFRTPTKAEWDGLLAQTQSGLNKASVTLAFNGNSQFGTAIHLGIVDANTKTLTLPALGIRNLSDGVLADLGKGGSYWCADYIAGNTAYGFYFRYNTITNVLDYGTTLVYKTYGLGVRCISVD